MIYNEITNYKKEIKKRTPITTYFNIYETRLMHLIT